MEWLKSSVKLLESALRERNKQMDIQRKEIEFLRKELRRKDEVILEYENIIKEREDMEDMEKKELEILHKEVWTLRNDVMTKVSLSFQSPTHQRVLKMIHQLSLSYQG